MNKWVGKHRKRTIEKINWMTFNCVQNESNSISNCQKYPKLFVYSMPNGFDFYLIQIR